MTRSNRIQKEGVLSASLSRNCSGFYSEGTWRPIDANPASEGDTCLGPDEGLCFAIEWDLPEDLPGVEDNIIQSDGVTFEISFRGATCGET